jgi:hypothetical protein
LKGQRQARLHLKFNDPWSHEWGPVHPTLARMHASVGVDVEKNVVPSHPSSFSQSPMATVANPSFDE